MGRLVVLAVLGAYVEIGDQQFSTGPERGEGTPFIVGQAFAEGDQMMIDFVDPNVEDILVRFRAEWTADEVWAGTLSAGDLSVPVTCEAG